MSPTAASLVVYGLGLLSLALLLYPPLRHIYRGAPRRRQQVLDSLTDAAIRRYLTAFYPADAVADSQLRSEFEKKYDAQFGRRHYFTPIVLFALTSGILLFLAAETVRAWIGLSPDGPEFLPAPAMAGIVGAYAWVLTSMVGRCTQLTLAPHHAVTASLRLLIAAPIGLAFSAVVVDPVGIPLALTLGAFPTRTLLTLFRRFAARRLELGGTSEQRSELEDLEGVDSSVAERFDDLGYRTIPQLAYSDPLALTIDSGFGFSFVVDCVSQALAWLYFEGRLAALRRYSFRGAQEIATFVDELDEARENGSGEKDEVLAAVAALVELKPVALEHTLREIKEDPYTEFLRDVWQTAEPTE